VKGLVPNLFTPVKGYTTLNDLIRSYYYQNRREAREAEGARLLSEYPSYNGIEGSATPFMGGGGRSGALHRMVYRAKRLSTSLSLGESR